MKERNGQSDLAMDVTILQVYALMTSVHMKLAIVCFASASLRNLKFSKMTPVIREVSQTKFRFESTVSNDDLARDRKLDRKCGPTVRKIFWPGHEPNLWIFDSVWPHAECNFCKTWPLKFDAHVSGIRQFFPRNLVKLTPCLRPPRIYPKSDKAKLKLPFN